MYGIKREVILTCKTSRPDSGPDFLRSRDLSSRVCFSVYFTLSRFMETIENRGNGMVEALKMSTLKVQIAGHFSSLVVGNRDIVL